MTNAPKGNLDGGGGVRNTKVGAFYERAYTDPQDDFLVWRRLMASMKVQSILRLTEQLAFDSQVETGTAQDIAEVLEIGAGTGAILEELSTRRPKWNLTALDVAEASIAAIRRLGLHNLREGMIADASRLPFSDKQFDLAILSHVIEHLPDPTTALREAKRVAHLVIIEVPVEGTPVLDAVWWIRKLRGRQRIPNELGHLWHRSVREWNRMIAGAGLTILANFQYLLTREALVFGKSGRSLRLARLRATGQVIFRTRVWGNLVYSHYAVLVT